MSRHACIRHSVPRSLLWAGLCAGLFLGCQKDEPITVYNVPKPKQVWEQNHLGDAGRELYEPAAAPAAPTAGTESMLLGGMLPLEKEIWFFKLTGAPEKVGPHLDQFIALIKELTLEGPRPVPHWKLPDGWQELPGNEFRYATLKLPDDLELTVSALPRAPDALPAQLLANLNRWRGQVSLKELSSSEFDKEVQTVTLADGKTTASIVALMGKSSGGGMGGPFSGGRGPMNRPLAPAVPNREPATASPLTYETPEGWQPGDLKTMRKAAFQIEKNGLRAEVTVIDLGRDGNDLQPNIDRWRGQVGLKPATPEELKAELKPISTLGVEAQWVALHGPGEGAKSISILGVYAVVGEKVWFIKLQGDSQLAREEQDHFLQFVKSLKFRMAGGV